MIGLVVVSFIAVPKLVQHAGFLETQFVGPLAFWMDQFSNGLLFFSLWLAFSSIFVRSGWRLILSILIGFSAGHFF